MDETRVLAEFNRHIDVTESPANWPDWPGFYGHSGPLPLIVINTKEMPGLACSVARSRMEETSSRGGSDFNVVNWMVHEPAS